GEVDLARRMERGNLRMRKALSRSPLVWRRALQLHDDVCRDGFANPDEVVREDARGQIARGLAKFARLHGGLAELERKLDSTPKRHVNVRAGLIGKYLRLQVECSREIRGIPFSPAQWKQFQAMLAQAVEE